MFGSHEVEHDPQPCVGTSVTIIRESLCPGSGQGVWTDAGYDV